MRKLLTLLTVITSLSVFAQKPITVTISGNIFNASVDSVSLSQYYGGTNYIDYLKAPLSKKGDFKMTGMVHDADYYVLRVGNTHINLILRDKADIKLYGDGANIFAFCNIVGSEESAHMNDFIKTLTVWNAKRDSAVALINQNPSMQQEISNSMSTEYYTFQSNMQTFIAQNQNSPALLPVISTIDAENDFATYESIVTQLVTSFGDSPSIKELNKAYLQKKAAKEARKLARFKKWQEMVK
jgi:hypothetical protein